MPPAAPAVSVLLPVRNAAGTLERAMASIRAQSWSDWELLVVDDGSTDGSGPLGRFWAERDPRIRVLNSPGRGIVPALNAGLAAARAPLIARMDADDEALPERLEAQVDYLRANPGIGLVGSLVRFGGDPERSAGYAWHVGWLNGLVGEAELALNRFVESPFAHPSVLFRRSCVERLGAYREGDFPEDYELWLRWAEGGVRMAKVPRELLIWNDPPSRLSRTDARYSPEAFYRTKAPFLASAIRRTLGLPPRDVWVWGAGRPTRKRAGLIEAAGVPIHGYIDIDPKKTGRAVAGRPVVPPERIPPPGRAFVLVYVGSRGARERIRPQLVARGYVEGRDFLVAA